MTVRIAPPEGGEGQRGSGEYHGEARSENIIASSVDAYVDALNGLLAEAHWAGATDAAGNRKRARATEDAASRARLDEDESHHDTTRWFNQ